ncbi:Azurin [Prosthecobacter debontii]|uniref:Azurin n=1 Tax=Prosthecobacter debontii TaxID=48467 RepID=A0A1T4Y6Y0_9BACT|nr:LamG-like jellyroll fold domain-containing protein [Prosthecobacter debontii]SKA97051.1 Azurin [Prosthecobacter debontii]
MPRFISSLCLLLYLAGSVLTAHAADDLFDRSNLAAWCIVPFDAKKRGPEERAAMLEKMGLRKFVYDYRAEHVPQWDDELTALKKHGIQLFGWWFPTTLNDEARQTLALFQKHGVKPQLWVNGNGGSISVSDEAEQKARLVKEVARLKPICEAAAPAGCQVALYNHGNWYGEPENAIAIIEALKAEGIRNIGMVYNLHHGHDHLDRLEKLLPKMLPHLLCLNLNGMDIQGDQKGRKILPLGVGTEDLRVLKMISSSGYQGVIGILNHTPEDAEGRLLDNLDGLNWLLPQLAGKAAGPKPQYRTWKEVSAKTPQSASHPDVPQQPQSVPSLNADFGQAMKGRLVLENKDAYRTLPISIECRVKLDSSTDFNVLVACDPKSSSDHWELYSYRGSGVFSVYLPGRGGEFKSKVNICDGKWHNLVVSIDTELVQLYVDGKSVLEQAPVPLKGEPQPGELVVGGLVEGGIGCDGIIDDLRISRGPMKPRKGELPRQRMDNTLALWDFDDLSALTVSVPDPAPFNPERKPLREADHAHWQHYVNRDRVFDYYSKQALAFMGKPLPELLPGFPGLDGGQQGHWGNQNDQVTWKDGRFAAADLGSVFSTVFKGAGLTVNKSVCVRYDDKSAVFDPETLSFPLVWTGGFVKLSDARHGFMGGGQMEGQMLTKQEGTKPADARYHGFYRHGQKVIFSYSVHGKKHLVSSPDSKDEDLAPLTQGGPSQWPQWLETKGVRDQDEPFATDTITIPFENPYGTLFFISGHDFFSDGSAAISTMTGEVWLVRGLDDSLRHVRWKRFATGLHQPLGVKILQDKLYVLGRDQITCLHDLNGDDEADFYECVTNAQETSPGGHDFITGLDADGEGSFYTASGNQGILHLKGGQAQVLATGFRNPNGIGLAPDGTVTTSVQEGDWTPTSSICMVTPAMRTLSPPAHFGANGPHQGQPVMQPLVFLPRGEDNSSGGQCFITQGPWAELKGAGNLVHFSPGAGSAFLVLRSTDPQVGGAALRIAGSFDSGAQTGRFHPKDGQLYVTGMQGWGCYTPLDGCFQRVRYTPTGKVPVPIAHEIRKNGILLRFDQPLDVDYVGKISHHFAQCWNYKYSAAYGSPEYSVRYPDTPGHDPLAISQVTLQDEGRSLFVEIPEIVPASILHLHVGVSTERSHDLFIRTGGMILTHEQRSTQKGPGNRWAKGELGREIIVEAALGLQFVQKQLTVKAGEKLTLTFKNPDVVPHNWLLAKPGSLQKLGDKVNLMITDPQGLAKHYVPESDDVLVYTDMTQPKQSFTIHFEAPQEKGDYPYLCTFPGHWMVMNGVLKVE